jgi:hypothetical protein
LNDLLKPRVDRPSCGSELNEKSWIVSEFVEQRMPVLKLDHHRL